MAAQKEYPFYLKSTVILFGLILLVYIFSVLGNILVPLVIKNNKVVGEERLLADKNERWRCMATGKDGAIYAATDGGKLYRIGK